MTTKIVCPKCNENMRMIHPYWVDPQVQCQNGECENHKYKLRFSEVKGESGFDFREVVHG